MDIHLQNGNCIHFHPWFNRFKLRILNFKKCSYMISIYVDRGMEFFQFFNLYSLMKNCTPICNNVYEDHNLIRLSYQLFEMDQACKRLFKILEPFEYFFLHFGHIGNKLLVLFHFLKNMMMIHCVTIKVGYFGPSGKKKFFLAHVR